MILLFNVLITDEKPPIVQISYDRGNLKSYSKIDVLKYCLSSLAVTYPWKKAILNIQLDGHYSDYQKDIETLINNEFKEFEVVLNWKRNETQQDWIDTYSLFNDDLIWYLGNHDHIFIDNSQEYLNKLVNSLTQTQIEFPSVWQTHWPECVRSAKLGYLHPGEILPRESRQGYSIKKDFITVKARNFDSFIIMNKQLYKDWFFTGDWGDNILPRTDYFGQSLEELRWKMKMPTKSLPLQTGIVPLKELCRHFDGYAHQHYTITNNQCPAIDIPPGFFEKDIKIRYGYDDYKEGWVNINPKNPNYYAHDKSGTDYKFTLKELPLVWKNKISVVDSNPELNDIEMLQYRLKSILEVIYNHENYNAHIDKEVEVKILNEYLASYPEYKLD